MNESEKTSGNSFGNWLSANLWAIICAAFVFGTGYTTTNLRISQVQTDFQTISAQLRDIKQMIRASDTADQCQVRTLDKLADRAGVEPPCQLEKAP
jgi:type II secretory pathway component PulF